MQYFHPVRQRLSIYILCEHFNELYHERISSTTTNHLTLLPTTYHKHQSTANSQILTPTTTTTIKTHIQTSPNPTHAKTQTMCFRRSFPTNHAHDGINTLVRKQRTASHTNAVTRALSRFRFFASSTFIKATGRSRRDEDGIDWGSEEVRDFIRPRDEEWGWNA